MATKEKTSVEIKLKGLQRKCDAATSELKDLKRLTNKQITQLTSDLKTATTGKAEAEAKAEDLRDEVKVLTDRTTSKSAKIEYLERALAKQAAAHAREIERVKLANVRKGANGGSKVSSEANEKMLAIQEAVERESVELTLPQMHFIGTEPKKLIIHPLGSPRHKQNSRRSRKHFSRKD